MLGLFSTKSKHPLADAKEMRRVLDELPGREAASALEETQAWLESLSSADDMKLEQCLELILHLDEAAVSHARRLGRDYLTAPRLARSEEYRLWRSNYDYWTQLIAAYEYCLNSYTPGDKSAKSVEPLLPLLYVRLLLAYAAGLKWSQFRYGPADGSYWLGLGRVYLAASAAKLERKRFPIYPNGKESSVEQEYLQVLMLHSSSVNKLLPLEVEIAEHLIAYVVPQLVFTDQQHPENVYWVDVAKPLPPTRLAKVPEVTATLRFLRPGTALDKITQIRASIAAAGAVPTDLQLGGQYPPAVVLPVLDHLALNWQPKPPMRSHQRHQVKSRLSVINGLAAIYEQLANGSDFFEDGAEAWIAEDVSVGGMGAQVPLGVNDWIHIGALVGVQPEGGENWLVGVVRRFNRGDGRGSVGIQTIGKLPRAIMADSGGLKTEVILLDDPKLPEPGIAGAPGYADVVLASSAWDEGIPMTFELDGRSLLLKHQALLEKGTDYVVVRYQVEVVFLA